MARRSSMQMLSSLPTGMATRQVRHHSIFQPSLEGGAQEGDSNGEEQEEEQQQEAEGTSSSETVQKTAAGKRRSQLNISGVTEETAGVTEVQQDTFDAEPLEKGRQKKAPDEVSIASSTKDTVTKIGSLKKRRESTVSASRRPSVFTKQHQSRRDSSISTTSSSSVSGVPVAEQQETPPPPQPAPSDGPAPAPPTSATLAISSLLSGRKPQPPPPPPSAASFAMSFLRKGTGLGGGGATAQIAGAPLAVPSIAVLFAARQNLLTLAKNSEWAQVELALKMMPKRDDRLSLTDFRTGETILMLACRDNKLVVIERLLELGVDVNAKANDNRTALHYAAEFCHDDVIKVLLAKKADPNAIGGPFKQLPLHVVLSRKAGVAVAGLTLLRATAREARIQTDGYGYLPISYAIQLGYFNIVRECLVFFQPEQLKWRHETTGDHLVHIAARKGNLKIMNYISIDCNANMNVQNNDGQTPLHIATTLGNEMLVRLMESYHANANILDKFEQTPIFIAAELGFTVIVEVLYERFRAKIHLRTKDGSTLMHRAAEKGYVDTVDAFIKRGVAIHMPNKSAYHALHIAAERGHADVVKLLVRKGSPVDARTIDGYTSLHIAVINCHPDIIQILLGYGSKVDLVGGAANEAPLHIAARLTEGGFACAEMLLKSGANVNKADGANSETPLHISARNGQLDILEMLLAEDGDPTRKSKYGETVLHVAVRGCHIKIVALLIDFMTEKFSADAATELINTQNNEGETVFHLAAVLEDYQAHYEGEDVDIVKLLLEKGADPLKATRVTLENALHYCSTSGNCGIASEIVRHLGNNFQAVCNRQSKVGHSPLMVACEQGNAEIVKLLLKNSARVDVFDEEGKAALHLAAEHGRTECCELLLHAKAFVNAKSRLGFTPLHFAAKNGFTDLVRKLVDKYHAIVGALTLDKKTPLHLAAENGQNSVCDLLMHYKADANAADEMGYKPLHLAAQNDFTNVLRGFIKRKPELVTAVSKNGMTCAHIAASKGAVNVLKELLQFNKQLVISTAIVASSVASLNDSLPIHLAVSSGFSDAVRVLIDAGSSDTSENSEGMSALHLAAKEGNVDVLRAIPSRSHLRYNSHKNGLAPIHVAAFYGETEFLRDVLAHVNANIKTQAPRNASAVADQTLRNLISTDYEFTCVHLACFNGHLALLRQLFNIPGVETDVRTAVLGRHPMHLACSNGHLPVVSILMSRSTGLLNVEDNRGRLPLHLAAENGHIEMVRTLLGQGAEIDAKDKEGWTALHCSTKGGFFQLVKMLVEAGASTTVKTDDGETPLMLAANGAHIESLSYLLQKPHSTEELMAQNSFLMDLMLCGKLNENQSIDEFVDNSEAPLYTAARLAKLYRELAFKERERAKDLNDAGRYLEHVATELLGMAATVAPPSVILRAVNSKAVSFLDTCLEDNLKEVIEHAVVQRYLSDIWAGSLSTWKGRKLVLLFLGFFFCPPIWAYYSLPLQSYHNYYHIPIIKFLALLVSHFYLIAILTAIAAFPLNPIVYRESFVPTWDEYLCLAWIGGMIVSELTNQGARSGLALFRPCIIAFAVGASLFQMAAIVYDLTGDHTTALNLMYCRTFMLSLALLTAVILTLDFLLIHHLFGEFGIVIAAVFKDLVIFLVVVAIFIGAFTCQICCLYSPIKGGIVYSSEVAATLNASVEPQLNMTVDEHFLLQTNDTLQHSGSGAFDIVENDDLMEQDQDILDADQDYSTTNAVEMYDTQRSTFLLSSAIPTKSTGGIMNDTASVSSQNNKSTHVPTTIAQSQGVALQNVTASPKNVTTVVPSAGNSTGKNNYTQQMRKVRSARRLVKKTNLKKPCRPGISNFTMEDDTEGPNATAAQAALDEQQEEINESDDTTYKNNRDTSILLTIFVTLYFSIFGMGAIDVFPVVLDGPEWSVLIIEGVFAAYMLVFTIVLIPLLIAMLTETYIRIHQRSEAEWKFGRAKLIRSMVKISSAPSPLNLFVRPYIYINAVRKHGWKMFTIYANYYVAEDEREGLRESLEGQSTAGESRSKTTPRRSGATKSALHELPRRLLLSRLVACLPWLKKQREEISTAATPHTASHQAPPRSATTDEGPQRIEEILDWSLVIRRYRSGKEMDYQPDKTGEEGGALIDDNAAAGQNNEQGQGGENAPAASQ